MCCDRDASHGSDFAAQAAPSAHNYDHEAGYHDDATDHYDPTRHDNYKAQCSYDHHY